MTVFVTTLSGPTSQPVSAASTIASAAAAVL
jgi:hypothetical protein